MVLENMLTGYEYRFVFSLLLSLIGGYLIGSERESRGKDAGISTQSLVIGGAMLFTFISLAMDPDSPARIAAQVVTGVGFLGAGIILKSKKGHVANLTTAASIWFSAAIGMAIGFGWYAIAVIGIVYAVLVPRVPRVKGKK